jgi:hypothetical protein
MKNVSLVLFVILLLAAFTFTQSDKKVSAKGTVIHFDFEGGFYGIVTDNGKHYLPENLNKEFQHDSLRVYFEGIITDKVTIQQWGRTIKLTKIEKIK